MQHDSTLIWIEVFSNLLTAHRRGSHGFITPAGRALSQGTAHPVRPTSATLTVSLDLPKSDPSPQIGLGGLRELKPPACRSAAENEMRTTAPTASAGSEFDEFLYAPIGEEQNGMLLSVLSALARRDVDPWEEAARLAQLPADAARTFLTVLLAALPDGPSGRTDPEALAARLIALLPRQVATQDHSPKPKAKEEFATRAQALHRSFLLSIVLTALFVLIQWLVGHSAQQGAPRGPAGPATVGVTLPQFSAPTSAPGPVPPPH
jgi:hypothetical protein